MRKLVYGILISVLVSLMVIGVGAAAIDKKDAVNGAAVASAPRDAVYTETSAGNMIASGGNVTEVNLTGTNVSTIKWAGYFGQVAADLYLGSGTSLLYSFGAAANNQIKSVFASTDTAFNFASLQVISAGDVDTVWSFATGDSDSETTVFTGTSTISQVTSVPSLGLYGHDPGTGLQNATLFNPGAFKDDGSATAGSFGTIAFGVMVIPNAYDYKNTTVVDYELIVPVNNTGITSNTQTYYFFLDVE